MKNGKFRPLKTARKSPILPSHPLLNWTACGTVALSVGSTAWAETLITFEGFSANNTLISSLPDYGDNVGANSDDYSVSPGFAGIVGTPNITLDWLGNATGGHWDTYIGWDGRGKVAQSDLEPQSEISIQFNPSASAAVRVVSFDLDEWAGGGAGYITWALSSAARGQLATANWNKDDAGGRDTISLNFTGLVGESLTLGLKLNSGSGSYFALDNLTFDQVPEPSTTALMTLGGVALGAAAMRRRKAGR